MQKSTLGSLINRFRFERQMARDRLQTEVWKRNKLDNPVKREGYEMRVDERRTRDGGQTIHVELWKKIDSETVQLEIDAKVVSVEKDVDKSDAIGDLLNG